MIVWSSLSKQTKREVKSFVISNVLLITLLTILSWIADVYPWQIMTPYCATSTSSTEELVKLLVKLSIVSFIYLLILSVGIFFILTVHGLASKLRDYVTRTSD